MAVRGSLDTRAGKLTYNVVQYKMVGRDKLYLRGATDDKLNSNQIDWVRIFVAPVDRPTEGIYTTLWGPYLSTDVIEGELNAAFDTDAYLEAIG